VFPGIRGLMVGRYYLTASHEDFDAGKGPLACRPPHMLMRETGDFWGDRWYDLPGQQNARAQGEHSEQRYSEMVNITILNARMKQIAEKAGTHFLASSQVRMPVRHTSMRP
jgi:hypothetical protein